MLRHLSSSMALAIMSIFDMTAGALLLRTYKTWKRRQS